MCRGGLLIRCCENGTADQLVGGVPSSCNELACSGGEQCAAIRAEKHIPESHTPESQPPAPRKCSDCAAVCSGAFKPAEAPPTLSPTTPALSECVGVLDAIETQPISRADDLALDRLSIPYPASDLPLRI